RDRRKGALQRVIRVDLEVVGLIRFQPARDSHRADALVERAIISLGRERLGSDVHGSLGGSEILEKARDRNHTDIVLALPKRGSFLAQNSDDRHRMAVNLDYFPNRRLMREKIFFDRL